MSTTHSAAFISGNGLDDLDAYIANATDEDPAFRAAMEDAEAKHRLLDTLVACRRDQGLTQSDIARRMGVKQPAVSGFENEDADPRLSTLQRYARAVGGRLRVSVVTNAHCDWLVGTPGPYREASSTLGESRVKQTGSAAAWPIRSWSQVA
jgi:transcriptional regulator with XRE-family HTH domain